MCVLQSCEEAITKLKNASSTQTTIYHVINQIMYPLVQGCETKDIKIIKVMLCLKVKKTTKSVSFQCCLQIIQRLITQQVVDAKGARYITDTLWTLMEASIEEVKILQSVTLLLTTNTIVHGETLARVISNSAIQSTGINDVFLDISAMLSFAFYKKLHHHKHSRSNCSTTGFSDI